ncbi:unnamed protein product [Rhodiola kirilowii]
MDQFIKLGKQKHVVEIKDEVDKYFNEPSKDPSNKNFNLLDWWKENASMYPIISKISKDTFAVPASTVALESAFSLGSRVLDPFRATLTELELYAELEKLYSELIQLVLCCV